MTIGRVFLALFAVCGAAQSAKNLGKHDSHFLQLVVPDGDAPEVLNKFQVTRLYANLGSG